MTRETALRQRLAHGTAELIADLYLYPEEAGGRAKPITIGWGCPCIGDLTLQEGWDGYPLLDNEMPPGGQRRVGFVFLSGQDAINALGKCERFYLWEGRFIGEAVLVSSGGRVSAETGDEAAFLKVANYLKQASVPRKGFGDITRDTEIWGDLRVHGDDIFELVLWIEKEFGVPLAQYPFDHAPGEMFFSFAFAIFRVLGGEKKLGSFKVRDILAAIEAGRWPDVASR